MPFQIHALPVAPFRPLFSLSDAALAERSVRREVVPANPGAPCRVSLTDAAEGEVVYLLNYEHLPADTPYRARHAIYVREGATQAFPPPGEVPEMLRRRLLSVRAISSTGDLVDADVVDGAELEPVIERLIAAADVACLHVHFAKQGCYAARVTRA